MNKTEINNLEGDNYKNIVENLPVAVVIFTYQGKVLYTNKKALALFKVSENELHKVNIFDFVTPQFLKIVEERKNNLLPGNELPPIEIETKNTQGKTIFIEIKTSAIIYNELPVLQTIITDTTIGKQLQEEKSRLKFAEESNKILKKEVDLRTRSEQKLRAIFESGTQLMWTVNKNIALTSFNKNYSDAIYNSYTKYPEINTDLTKPKSKFASDEYHAFWDKKYAEAFAGKTVEFETETSTSKGEIIHRRITLHPIYNDEKEIIEVAGQGQDITQEKNDQREIYNKQSQLAAIINTTNDIIFSMDKNYNIVQFNSVMDEIAEQRTGKKLKTGTNFFDYLPIESHNWLKETYQKALKGENVVTTEIFLHPKTKTYRTYEANYNPITINGEIIGISVFSRDITEQKLIEQKILNTQSQLSAIINNTTDLVVSIDKNYNIVQFNWLLSQMVKARNGIELKEGTYILDIIDPEQHKGLINIYKQVFAEGKHQVVTEIFEVSENKKLHFESNYNPIKHDNETVGIAIFSRDITEKINVETELREALKEKEILLKEVHHRVKNNLQVISSILNLQTGYLKDKETINILKECQNRIKTMAYIHESLYQTKDFLQINFSEYIINLVKNLFYSYDANQQKIKANFDVDTIFLNLDTSIPCGLIINELVSNAFKYAFADGREGFISVKIKKIKNKKIRMLVSDSGKGLPTNIDFKNTESLGLQLVTILSEQINATLTLDQTNGTTFEIIF